jgi:hypothetical protein
MARHPLDVLSSSWRRSHADPGWARLTIDQFCGGYRSYVLALNAFREHSPERLLVVRYDDLTSLPESTAMEVCSFLSEPFEPSMVNLPDRFGGWPVDPHLLGRIVQVTKDWRDFLDHEVASEVERRLQGPMQLLGFQPRTSSSDADAV